ncbi:hypothetical protein B0H12DRAFT_238922 [Mycena haematopus]|nr:hypothetical protein B0H12DRAFT_238922 [Mycena haematopus]
MTLLAGPSTGVLDADAPWTAFNLPALSHVFSQSSTVILVLGAPTPHALSPILRSATFARSLVLLVTHAPPPRSALLSAIAAPAATPQYVFSACAPRSSPESRPSRSLSSTCSTPPPPWPANGAPLPTLNAYSSWHKIHPAAPHSASLSHSRTFSRLRTSLPAPRPPSPQVEVPPHSLLLAPRPSSPRPLSSADARAQIPRPCLAAPSTTIPARSTPCSPSSRPTSTKTPS